MKSKTLSEDKAELHLVAKMTMTEFAELMTRYGRTDFVITFGE